MSKSFNRIAKSKLSISKSHKKILMCSLLKSFVINHSFITTLPRARYFKSFANVIFNKLKSNDVNSKRYAYKFLNDKTLVDKMSRLYNSLNKDSSENFVNLYKVGYRRGDGAILALVSLKKNE